VVRCSNNDQRATNNGWGKAVNVLAHRVDGAGEPLVLLNGGMMSMSSWDHLMPAFAARFRVVRCDFRGQLLSPGEPPADMAGHAEEVVRLLDHLAIDRAHLVGTSFGAEVGLALAALHAERAHSLVAATATDVVSGALRDGIARLQAACLDVLAGGDRGQVFDLSLPLFYSPPFLTAHRAELEARRDQVTRLPDEWFAAADRLLATLVTLDLRPLLPRIACPVLAVAAEKDEIMPLERMRALAAAIPGARLAVVPDSGHVLVVERAEKFATLCLDFLAEVTTQGGVT
jgi:pimeloyl-ACP methyl ester carboxylesterase